MKKLIYRITTIYPSARSFHFSLLLFRIAVSTELMTAHGLKKIGVGVQEAEHIPNPLLLPKALNQYFAIAANLFFPVFIILGLFTRVAVLPILAVTLSGYFVLHWHDSLLEKDMPVIYSLVYLFLFIIGPGKYSLDDFINKGMHL